MEHTLAPPAMARPEFGRLRDAWVGEASDFTPLLAEQLDLLGDAIAVDLGAAGSPEVRTDGGRSIDIVAESGDGTQFVIENQYGTADHDHLTRGLAYAVARKARGLVVVAEHHRDEFRAVADYLNGVAEQVDDGIVVWLVEARAIRIGDSPWAPIFSAVVAPNRFTQAVTSARTDRIKSIGEFLAAIVDDRIRTAAATVLDRWPGPDRRIRFSPDAAVLEATGPSVAGRRAVVSLYTDGRILVPFSGYAGANSGVPIAELTSDEFRAHADTLFGFAGYERLASTAAGWLTPERTESLLDFADTVAAAYLTADVT